MHRLSIGRQRHLWLWLALWLQAASGQSQENPFLAGVRPTDPLTPEQEQRSFVLPPGFRIDLVAAEPEILKPLNMAFDARGRLWVTVTQEYPYPAPADRTPGDAVKILEDRNGDGRADKVTTFADGLNIPIGIYPYGRGAIVYGIPHIWYLEDTDGDDVADRRTKLYGPMGYERDTHGMNNAFRRGFDGWLYACHGFNNETRVSGADGHEIHMQSGNTYRMRLDGARVEHFTWGQVNPFGMTIDANFDLFTADCHSKPVYQLVRDGYYPSFGKPHDGLGFISPMMEHLHNSTAIAGVARYSATQFPEPFRQNLFSGNVMTSRINRNSLIERGSTLVCREEADFLETTDPWFRPVDICLGPDGALYIADFYNRIIGHYEVPLDHPGRDRTSGRIWRVTYAPEGAAPPDSRFDISQATAAQLIELLDDDNLTRRMLALDQLSDRLGPSCQAELRAAATNSPSAQVRALAMWGLHRIGALSEDVLRPLLADSSSYVRLHALKAASETAQWSPELAELVRAGLDDSHPFARRAAADALGRHPQIDAAADLLETLLAVPAEDALLRQNVRIALRNQLRASGGLARLAAQAEPQARRELVTIALGFSDETVAAFLLDYLAKHEVEAAEAAEWIRHAASCAGPAEVEALVRFARLHFSRSSEMQLALLDSIRRGLEQRQAALPELVRTWAQELALSLAPDAAVAPERDWLNFPLAGAARADNPWVLQQRPAADGQAAAFLCSLPKGEQLTGRLRSPVFEIPARLSFYIAGHSGFPDKPLNGKNSVRLCDATSGEILRETTPPRNDTAQLVEWDLAAVTARRGYLEIVDGDEAGAYAWLAVGRFSPAVVELPATSPGDLTARHRAMTDLIRQFGLRELEPRLISVLQQERVDSTVAAGAAEALLALQPQPGWEILTQALADPSTPAELMEAARGLLISRDAAAFPELAAQLMRAAPARAQQRLALSLATSREGLTLLIDLIAQGKASPRMLQGAAVLERIRTIGGEALAERAAALTANLPAPRDELLQLMAQRRAEFARAPRDLARGAQVFAKSCAACHQVAGKGPLIGPQLDGIGNRGLERLLEDIFDPNRNVDVAFRTTTLQLESGKVVTGLVRGERGGLLVLADEKGQELTVPKAEIEQQAKANLSLMPENIATTIMEDEFHDLMAYLLDLRGK